MAFAEVPTESRSRINKAGEILAARDKELHQYLQALDLAERWRACHAYPINTFQATLRKKLSRYGEDPIGAQRLKRMTTIIDKLRRYPAMKLTTMQDIGGVRAIMSTIGDVEKLVYEYKESERWAHELVDEKDYIDCPRDEDGYRSIHLIYKYRNKQAPQYDGLRIELQIRTRLQHTWATAVECMGTFLGQALKSRQGDKAWIDFFALVSAVFARTEKTSAIPRFAKRSMDALRAEVVAAETRLNALNTMTGLTLAASVIQHKSEDGKGWSYHLIILNSLERTVQVKPYDRDSFARALDEYARFEEKAASGEPIEPVLVSAGPMKKLRRAYPNFFLDINDFAEEVNKIRMKIKRS